jgi:DNA-binding transcriptional LysR family regulator
LGEDELRCDAVAHSGFARNAKHTAISTPDDLPAHNCIQRRWTRDGAIHPWEFEANGWRSQVVVGGSFIVNVSNLILQAAIAGVGIGHLPEMMVAAPISEGRLVPLLEDWTPRLSGLFLYYPSRRQVPQRGACQRARIIAPQPCIR